MNKQIDFIKTLSEIVQIPSFSKEEEELAQYLYGFCIKHKLPVDKQDKNIVIKFLTGSDKCLIFDAHLDTVKAGDLNRWNFPPFGKKSGVIKNGRLYGLGASDDKASIASLLGLALEFFDKKPPIDVFIFFVTNEEVNGEGSKTFMQYFKMNYKNIYKEIAAIVAEPTDLNSIELGYRSTGVMQITTSGDSGHGARPEEIKIHSIYKMFEIIKKINVLEEKLKVSAYDPILGYPTITLTGIHSVDTAYNQIPSTCKSIWDVRVTPKIEKKLLPIFKQALGREAKVELIKSPKGCIKVNPNERIIKIFKKIMPNLKTQSSKGTNDSGDFIREGIPAITFGPGFKSVIHKENEYAVVNNIYKAKDIYLKLIQNY